MSDTPVKSNTSPILTSTSNVKSPHLLSGGTKMYILSPNVLKSMGLDKIVKKEATVVGRKSYEQIDPKESTIPIKPAMSTSKSITNKSPQSPQTSRQEKKGHSEEKKTSPTDKGTRVPKKHGYKRKLDTSADESQSTIERFLTLVKKENNVPDDEKTQHSTKKIKRVSNECKDNAETLKGRRNSKTSIENISLNNSESRNSEEKTNAKDHSRRSGRVRKQPLLEDYIVPSRNSTSASPKKIKEQAEDIDSKIKDSNYHKAKTKNNDPETPETSERLNGDSSTTEDTHPINMDNSIAKDKEDCQNGNANDTDTEDIIYPPRRGRPPGRGRGRGSGRGRGRGRKALIPMDSSTEDLDPANSVTCNKCEMMVGKKQWAYHNLYKHNNMSWIKGGKPMDFENDVKLWRRVLTVVHKKRGQFTCEECAAVKRSINGFISHLQFCGKSEEEKRELMAKCPICNAVMMPSSMESHERMHRQTEQKKAELTLQKAEEDTERKKRRSAQQALTKISETATILIGSNDKSMAKDIKPVEKNIMKLTKDTNRIPSIWKTIWKKELITKKATTCRHIGCTYVSTTLEDIVQHSTTCSFRLEESFFCKICKFASETKANMIKHVQQEHTLDEEYDKSSDFDNESESSEDSGDEEESTKKRKWKTPKSREVPTEKTSEGSKVRFINKFKFLDDEMSLGAKFGQPYIPAIRWTMEFEQKNYVLELFEEYGPNNFTMVENSEKYLPKVLTSMRCKTSKKQTETTNIDWKTWTRFEGGFDEDVPTFFAGGPIKTVSWLPIPAPMYLENPNQFVALSTHPNMENEYVVGKPYFGPNVIQIWNLGCLENAVSKPVQSPSFSYGIAHNSGTVWCLQWCPSGCYQDPSLKNYNKDENDKSLRRMGMLAAACSDGCVHIYSLPFPEELQQFRNLKADEFPIYETKPVFTLVANISIFDANEQNWQCTKISWTKERGHNMIAAGFSNGYIALWDLTIKSPYLIEKRGSTYILNAFQHIFAHVNAVSMISIVPYNGQRFLASGSIDRSYKFWDLENSTTPQACVKRSIITDGTWLVNWPCAVFSFDDAYTFQRTCSLIFPLREYAYKAMTIIPANATCYSVAFSEYGNGIAHGTLSGDICTIFPHRLLHRSEKMSQRRRVSSVVRTVDFQDTETKKADKKTSKEYNYMPTTYEDSKDRFGMIFNDKQNDNWSKLTRTSINCDDLTPVPIEQYPFASVNQVSWNPNCWSHLWLMCGYQNGIVRLLSFKPIPMNPAISSLIPWHAEQMLKKHESR